MFRNSPDIHLVTYDNLIYLVSYEPTPNSVRWCPLQKLGILYWHKFLKNPVS